MPDLYRLPGAALLRQGGVAGSHEALRRGIELAQEQRAAFRELRNATLLAGSLHEGNRSVEAKAVITPVLRRFTEGFDTPDPREAQALVETLYAS